MFTWHKTTHYYPEQDDAFTLRDSFKIMNALKVDGFNGYIKAIDHYRSFRPTAMAAMITPVLLIFDHDVRTSIAMINGFIFALAVVGIFLMCSSFFNLLPSFITTLIVATAPVLLIPTKVYLAELPFLSSLIFLFLIQIKMKEKLLKFFLLGCVSSFPFFFRPMEAFAYVGLFWIYFYWIDIKDKKINLKQIISHFLFILILIFFILKQLNNIDVFQLNPLIRWLLLFLSFAPLLFIKEPENWAHLVYSLPSFICLYWYGGVRSFRDLMHWFYTCTYGPQAQDGGGRMVYNLNKELLRVGSYFGLKILMILVAVTFIIFVLKNLKSERRSFYFYYAVVSLAILSLSFLTLNGDPRYVGGSVLYLSVLTLIYVQLNVHKKFLKIVLMGLLISCHALFVERNYYEIALKGYFNDVYDHLFGYSHASTFLEKDPMLLQLAVQWKDSFFSEGAKVFTISDSVLNPEFTLETFAMDKKIKSHFVSCDGQAAHEELEQKIQEGKSLQGELLKCTDYIVTTKKLHGGEVRNLKDHLLIVLLAKELKTKWSPGLIFSDDFGSYQINIFKRKDVSFEEVSLQH